jgi:hypothetical protein
MTDAWSNGASVSVATAIRYGPAHFIVDAREADGAHRLVKLSGDAHGVDVVVSTNNQEFRFRFPDGSAVTITYHGGNPRAYLNHQIDVPGCVKGRTLGLCGTYDGNRDNDWTAHGGAVVPDVNAFGNSWRVPATDDIFVCKHNCPDALADRHVIKPCDQCRIPETLEGPGVFVDNQNGYRQWNGPVGTYTRAKPDYSRLPKVLVPRPPNNPDFDARAERACHDAFADLHDARAILPPDAYIRSCISDCRLSGSLEMVDAAKTAYSNRVYTNVRPVLNLAQMAPARRSGYANSPEVQSCERAANVLGLGARNCPNNCSGNGICLKRGCVCRPGFTGIACRKSLSAYGAPLVGGGRANAYRQPVDDFYPGQHEDDFMMAPRPQFGGPQHFSPANNMGMRIAHPATPANMGMRMRGAPFEDDAAPFEDDDAVPADAEETDGALEEEEQ